jgi:hypothetical protein
MPGGPPANAYESRCTKRDPVWSFQQCWIGLPNWWAAARNARDRGTGRSAAIPACAHEHVWESVKGIVQHPERVVEPGG